MTQQAPEGDVRYLSTTPRVVLERHRDKFLALSRDETCRVWVRLQQDQLVPRKWTTMPGSGEELYDRCSRLGLDQCQVVLAIVRERDQIGVSAIEKLVGSPIRVWSPPSRSLSALPAAALQVAPRQGSAPAANWHDLTVLSVAPNPKKKGSATYARYQHWKVGRTVAECMLAGLTLADVKWDIDPSRRFVVVGPSSKEKTT